VNLDGFALDLSLLLGFLLSQTHLTPLGPRRILNYCCGLNHFFFAAFLAGLVHAVSHSHGLLLWSASFHFFLDHLGHHIAHLLTHHSVLQKRAGPHL
jgi:hypothetical protein